MNAHSTDALWGLTCPTCGPIAPEPAPVLDFSELLGGECS